ncbi:MAG: 50S ribosomal protein L20 [Clostridia bacterium]|nr:50S ribosomal protein L20 [Clostridia bacterium]
MARVKGALNTRKHHKKVLKLAKGFRGSESKQYRVANQAVMRSMQNAYIGRKHRKRDFRRLWITRISAACKLNGMNYSTFMNGLKKSGIEMNRKMLSEIAIADPKAFEALCETAKDALK